jgi:hypothetical protein
MADVLDGTSNTLAMAEARLGLNSGMWDTRRRDPRYIVANTGNLVQSPAVGSNRTFTNSPADIATINAFYLACLAQYDAGSGYHVESADRQGRFWVSGRMVWSPHISTLIGPNAGPGCNNDESVTLLSVKEASSYHPGGVMTMRADASVTFASETINQGIWIALGTMNGGEAISQ